MSSHPIAALATPTGRGALCVLRISGTGAVAVVENVWRGRRTLADCPPRQLVRGMIVNAAGQVVDDVLAVRFAAPASFTGEEMVEISAHGGQLVARLLLDTLFAAGADPAEPGEFSQRAFLNGKMDLAQAEAIMDIIGAQTALALRAAQQQLSGGLSQKVVELRGEIMTLLADVEAHIDFPDEDISPDTGAALLERINSALAAIVSLLATAERGRILRHCLRLVIAGAPNAGKSSLLNRLLGFDRAIVSAEAGTTRDTVEETIDLGGVPVRLVDTAGIHENAGRVENLGIDRSKIAIDSADFVLELVDGSIPPDAALRISASAGASHHLLVLNKADKGIHPNWSTTGAAVRISCTTGSGINELVAAIQQSIHTSASDIDDTPLAINARHQHCLESARHALLATKTLLAASSPPEIVAEELRSALHSVGEIIGRVDSEDILGLIFSRFCIGK